MGLFVSTSSLNDNPLFIPLLKVIDTIVQFRFKKYAADKGYDDKDNLRIYGTPTTPKGSFQWKDDFKKRTSVERVFSDLSIKSMYSLIRTEILRSENLFLLYILLALATFACFSGILYFLRLIFCL